MIACIPCDFQYTDEPPSYPDGEELTRLDLELERHSKAEPSYGSFSCEDDSYPFPQTFRDIWDEPKSKYLEANESKSESHEYEEIETSCGTKKRTIQPKALNNIYNRLTKVINTDSFVQSIHIEECL